MTTRAVPRLVAAFSVGGARPYRNERDAYYQIAKALVVAKYPAWLTRGSADLEAEAAGGWSRQQIAIRTDKALHLFHHPDALIVADGEGYAEGHFDERRWRAFIVRVARFLRFVDKRRKIGSALSRMTDQELQDFEQIAESETMSWETQYTRVRDELARRKASR